MKMKNEMIFEPVKSTGKYKQTEIGLIPDCWEIMNLGHVGEVKMCRRVFNHETSSHGQIPFFKIGTFGKEPDAFISQSLYNLYRQKFSFPQPGEILISAAGTIGRTIVYNGEDAYYQDSNIVWLSNDEKLITNEFLFYVLQIAKYNTEGGTIQRLYNSILKSTKFICPSLPEQTAIAEALSDADAMIASLEKLIEKKKKIKQGAMQELLRPKEGWVKKKLGEIGFTYGGLSGKSKVDFSNGNARYIQFMNIMSNSIIDMTDLPTVMIRKGEKQNTALKGDLFFNGSSETPEEVGMCSVLLNDVSDLYLNSFCFGFRAFESNRFDGLFLANYFRSPIGRELFYSSAQGATRYNLSKSNFLKLEVELPVFSEQCEIAKVINDIDAEIISVSSKLQKAQQIKQGMMQNLLTGKIRLE